MCNGALHSPRVELTRAVLEYKDTKVVYRRYASLFFITGIGAADNELITLEIIHRYVEVRPLRPRCADVCRSLTGQPQLMSAF